MRPLFFYWVGGVKFCISALSLLMAGVKATELPDFSRSGTEKDEVRAACLHV